MKRLLLFAMLVAAGAAPRAAAAQRAEYDNRDLNNCVRSFYDPDTYNWFAFENTCSESITIVFGKKGDTERVEGTLTLRPGRKDSIGQSRTEVAAWGGVSWYVCPAGYLPSVNNSYPDYTGKRYTCKKE